MAGRTLWGVTVMADDEEVVADGLVTTLHHTAAYMRMRFGGVLLGNGSRPGQIRDDERAMLRAKTFFQSATPPAPLPLRGGDGRRGVVTHSPAGPGRGRAPGVQLAVTLARKASRLPDIRATRSSRVSDSS